MHQRSPSRRPIAVAVATLAVALPILGVASPSTAAVTPRILGADSASAIADSYLVKLKDTAAVRAQGIPGRARALADAHHGTLGSMWEAAMSGFAVTMSEADAQRLATEPDVSYVQQNMRWRIAGTQPIAPSWGLDRIDEPTLPTDHAYTYPDSGGQFANVYVVDSGIQISHTDFAGRARYGRDTYDKDDVAQDCNGHGTAVAGIIGGHAYGVAKKTKLVAVRVVDCFGLTNTTSIQDGLNWVIANAVRPAVINLSLAPECIGGPCPPGSNQAITDAVTTAISIGITVVAGAGNQNQNACNNPVPAVNEAITVGAVDDTDARWVGVGTSGSNFGPCVDIWAPGAHLPSDSSGSDTATSVFTGTSVAAAFVSGVAALMVGADPIGTLTPAQVRDQIIGVATHDVLTNLGAGSPNLMLYSQAPLPSSAPTVALARQADLRLALFGVGPDGFVYSRFETSPGSGVWGPWAHSATKGWYGVAAETNPNFQLELAALTPTGQVFHRQQAAPNNNSWTNWSSLDGQLASLALTRGFAGRLELYGSRPADGTLQSRRQAAAGSANWDASRSTDGPPKLTAVAADVSADVVQVIATSNEGMLWRGTHEAPAPGESGALFWTLLDQSGNIPMSETALAHNSDSSLELVGTNGHGGIWRRHNNAPSVDAWTAWSQLPPMRLRHIAAETTASGCVIVVGVAPDGTIWQSTQTAVNSGTYSAWTQIDGLFKP